MSFLSNLSPESVALLNLIFNFTTFTIAVIGAIFVSAIFIKNKWREFKNPPDIWEPSEMDFLYLDKVIKNSNLENHVPCNNSERDICERLRAHGIFAKNPNGSYRITKAGEKAWEKEVVKLKEF